MSEMVPVSKATYEWLQAEAEQRGLSSIEEVLEAIHAETDEASKRHEIVAEIDAIRERLAAKYGKQSDSVDLIREDRDR